MSLASDHSEYMSEPIVLVCGADDKFSMPLAITLFSALQNLRAGAAAKVFVIDGGIAQANKRRIENTLSSTGKRFELQWMPFDMNEMGSVRETSFISKATYLRILVPKLLPSSIQKAVYLDCDMIVETDLYKLWQLDFNGSPAMAVQDFCFPYLATLSAISDFSDLGLPAETPYCNVGMMVMNLAYWRQHHLTEQIFAYLKRKGRSLGLNDQDGINALIAGNWLLLDPRWNVTLSSLADFGQNRKMTTAEAEVWREQLRTDPYIIHFTSRYKPWHTGSGSPEALNSFYYDQRFIQRYHVYLKKSSWFRPLAYRRWVARRRAVLFWQYKLPRRLRLFFPAMHNSKTVARQ